MKTVPSIRQATPNDHAKLKEIIDVSFPRFFRFFASHSLDSEEGKVLVSENQSTIVGFAKLIEFHIGSGKYGCILWLAVHPEHRRKCIASALVNAGTENLKHIGAKMLQCKEETKRHWQLLARRALCEWIFWVYGGFSVFVFLVFTARFGMRLEKSC